MWHDGSLRDGSWSPGNVHQFYTSVPEPIPRSSCLSLCSLPDLRCLEEGVLKLPTRGKVGVSW